MQIETTVSGKRPSFVIVGLPDAAIRESRERVKAAIRQSGFEFPGGAIVVNLSPADLPKVGATYDLPIALSVLAAASKGTLHFNEYVSVGELSLEGRVRPVRAALGATVVAEKQDKTCLLSSDSFLAALSDTKIAGVTTLREAVEVAQGRRVPVGVRQPERPDRTSLDRTSLDLGEIRDQHLARRALEVAAAGAHHLLLIGSPGAGKTMLARSLPSILPPLDAVQQRDVALVWAAAGAERLAGTEPPFRAPHHSASMAALVGGGSGLPTPGEVSKAHHGVLFLDELGEFPTSNLDALRQPIEDGSLTVSRQAASVRFPSQLQLIAASNPCPCGYLGDRLVPCECTDVRKNRYTARLSGPLLDRFDMRINLHRLRVSALAGPRGEASEAVRRRVIAARERQSERGTLNSTLSGAALDEMTCSADTLKSLTNAAESRRLTARGWDRVRRVACTIADLEAADRVRASHIQEALELRGEI